MHRVWVALAVAGAACGRVGFDTRAGADGAVGDADAARAGDARVDGPGLTNVVMFGESTAADHRNVTMDTFLSSNAATLNHGITAELFVDGAPVTTLLLRFDVSNIPVGAVVMDATLAVTSTNPSIDATVRGFALLESWTEGSADMAPGAASWNERAPGMPWSTPGALGSSRSGQVAFEIVGPIADDTRYAPAFSTTVVQQWVDDATQNHGIVIEQTTGSDGPGFAAREHGIDGYRPTLTVTYVF